MFRSLFDHLQAEYTILVFGKDYTNNGSVVLYSIFHFRARSYGLFLYVIIVPLSINVKIFLITSVLYKLMYVCCELA
jgi:hypothetical protein